MGGIAHSSDWLFGVATLMVGLSVLATIPICQLLSLGYLLEVSGRVARAERLRAGLVGVHKAARLGKIVVGILILLFPLWFASSLSEAARLIDSGSLAARGWRAVMLLLSLYAVLQVVSACLRGAKLHHFLWPRPIETVKLALAPGAYGRARDAVWAFTAGLHLPYYLWLGVRGAIGTGLWLALPVSILAASSRLAGVAGVLAGLLGGALLALTVMQLPFLQARLGETGRLSAMFELRFLRQRFVRAPMAFAVALLFTLALAVPLYLFKIEIVPREAAWLPSLLFVVSMFPSRVLSGWALARGAGRESPRPWILRWAACLAMLAVASVYVVLVYFTQYLSWYGVWSLYEQHAFLVPAPFLDL
jgi:hypothetical protein